jgi:type II secretory pathway pseudopilin PulG
MNVSTASRASRRSTESDPRASRRADEGGFGLVELVVSISVLALVTLTFAGGMAAALRAYTVSRAETIASQVATEHVESIRRMAYDEVGIPSGNPPGTIVATQSRTIDGYSFTVVTDVEYVNDAVPTAFVTEADYKRVKVTVTQVGKTKADASIETLVAPPAAASSTTALVRVNVVDFGDNTPIPGATVNLLTGPSAPRSDIAAANGRVTFPALTPNPTSGSTAYYDVNATAAGYTTLREDVSPATSAHAQLSASQTFSTSIRMYKPVSIVVNLLNVGGTAFAGAAVVTVHSSRGDESFAVSGGTATITQAAGELLVPGVSYTLSATASSGSTFYLSPSVSSVVPASGTYPTSLSSTFNLTMTGYTSAPLTVNLRQNSGSGSGCAFTGTTTRNAALDVQITGGPQSISLTVQTVNGTVNVLVPTGSTAYTVTVPPQGSYSGSGTKVVTTTSTCNLKVG